MKELNLPQPPEPPVLPSDLASELSVYEATHPDLADVSPALSSGSADAAGGADAYLAFLERVRVLLSISLQYLMRDILGLAERGSSPLDSH